MFEQLEKIEKRYSELEHLLASYDAISDKEQYNKYAKELSDLKESVSLFREFKKASEEIIGLEKVLSEKHDEEFIQLARAELAELKQKITGLEEQLKKILIGEDKNMGKNIIVEIRQGTGGMEGRVICR